MRGDKRLKILLLGRTGQVGWELESALAPQGEIISLGRTELDLADFTAVRDCIDASKPDIIVNAAAYTAVDKAEKDQEAAGAINEIIPRIVGAAAKKIGSVVLHYSTDYVFDGEKLTPYSETDATRPINIYGRTKLAGELALQNSGAAHVILRTGWIYGLRGSNFLLAIQKRLSERQPLTVVNDQTGAPTWSRLIAEATSQIIALKGRALADVSGVYHLTCQGQTTWYEFAQEIAARQAGLEGFSDIQPVSSDQYKMVARRPRYSVLSNEKLQATFGILLPDWRTALSLALR